jgi:uncharacterized protein
VFAASFAKVLQPALAAGSSIEVIARGGGIGNPVVVNEGKAQLAIANSSTSNWAWNGDQEIYKGKKHQNIRGLLGGLNEVWLVAMLTEDYTSSGPATTRWRRPCSATSRRASS